MYHKLFNVYLILKSYMCVHAAISNLLLKFGLKISTKTDCIIKMKMNDSRRFCASSNIKIHVHTGIP